MVLWLYHPQSRGFVAPSIQATGCVDQRCVREFIRFFWSSRTNTPSLIQCSHMPTTPPSCFDYLNRVFRLFRMLPHGPGGDCLGVHVHILLDSTVWAETTPNDTRSCTVFGGRCKVNSSGSLVHGIILRQMQIYISIFDVTVMLLHCVLMPFSVHIVSLWFWCLKCSLVCVCYVLIVQNGIN